MSRFCEVCHAPILLDDWEVYRGITRDLCIFCEDKREEARHDAADIMAEYRRAKGEGRE